MGAILIGGPRTPVETKGRGRGLYGVGEKVYLGEVGFLRGGGMMTQKLHSQTEVKQRRNNLMKNEG